MPIPRFRTTTLMIAVAAPAVAIAGLRYASDAWATWLFTATLAALATAVLVAIARAPADPRRWGVAVFGLGYLFVSLHPEGRAQLAPSAMFERLYFTVHTLSQPIMSVYPSPVKADMVIDGRHFATNPVYPGQPAMIHSWPYRGRLPAFERVGHSLFALMAGMLGAVVGRAVSRSEGRATAPSLPTESRSETPAV
jgi:hypothetical protein